MTSTKSDIRPIIVEDEIDLLAIWERVKIAWFYIVLVTILFSIVGGIFGMTLPPKYKVSAVLHIPTEWRLKAINVSKIVDNYSSNEKYKNVCTFSISPVKESSSSIDIICTTSDIAKGRKALEQLFKDLTEDENIKSAEEKSQEKLQEQIDIIDKQIEDAYQTKNIYDLALRQEDSSIIIGSNPVDINKTIMELETSKQQLEDSLDSETVLSWAITPCSDKKDTQISTVVLVILFGMMGGFIGVILAIWQGDKKLKKAS